MYIRAKIKNLLTKENRTFILLLKSSI
jgi:hypothetical protein